MKLFHICTKKDFEQDGEKKTKWYRIGILKEAESGRKYMKLFHQPDVEFFVFEKEENNQGVAEAVA